MKEFKYKVSLTENQLNVVNAALEDYVRTRMNQWLDFSTEVAQNGFVYDKDNPDNDKLFSEYIQRRNDSKELFEKAYAVAAPNPYKREKTPYMQTAVLRY